MINESQIDNVQPEPVIDSDTLPMCQRPAQILPIPLLCAAFSTRINPVSELYNMDCVEGMKHYPDKYFDLAIVDPPYGIDIDKDKKNNFVITKHKSKGWDKNTPNYEYFIELWRVSKNRIIWGGNYFELPPTKCYVVWDKVNPMPRKFADAELAWTSFDFPTKIFKQAWIGYGRKFIEKDGFIHPTQKPKRLYDWLLQNFAQKGQRILDTHVGSGSSRIICYKNEFDFVGFEIDKEYCELSEKRFINETKQQRLF